jgi:hypothetical protein
MEEQLPQASGRKKPLCWLIVVLSAPLWIPFLLGVCDAGTSLITGHPVLSKCVARYWDGGSELHAGCGYHIFYMNRLEGERGPVLWCWFTPFEFSLTTRRIGIYPLGNERQP